MSKTSLPISWALLLTMLALSAGCHPPATPPPTKPVYPVTVRVVVDTSASMRGYFEGETEFKDTVAAVAAALDRLQTQQKGLQKIEYVLLGDRGSLDSTPYATHDFIEQMRTNQLVQHKDSLLQNAFRNILESSGPNDVSLLISDSIVSYPDTDIRANPHINLDNVASLGSEVETVFAHGAQQGESALLLASTSSFHGRYFDYANQAHPCCSGKRPFYIWLIGHAAQIQAIAAVFASEQLHFDHEIDFHPTAVTPNVAVLETLSRTGTFYRGRPEKDVIEPKQFPGGKPIQFAVALDLQQLPSSLQDVAFLRTHLHVSDKAQAITLLGVAAKADVEDQKNNDARTLLPDYTHVLFLALNSSVPKRDDVEITIDSDLPGWYRDWSNTDDIAVNNQTQATTFGLRYLVEGVAKAYSGSGPIAKTSIHVER